MSWKDVREAVLLRRVSELRSMETLVHRCKSQRLQKTALHLAIKHNVAESFNFLIVHHPQLLQKNNVQDKSVLDYAIVYNRLDMVQKLIHLCPQLMQNYNKYCCKSTLQEAVVNGNVNAFRIMLTTNPDLALEVSWKGDTLLHFAAYPKNETLDMMQYLLSILPHDMIFAKCRFGAIALHYAVQNNNFAAVKQLYQAEPLTVHVKMHDGLTPFALAVAEDRLTIVEFWLNDRPNLIDDLHIQDQKNIAFSVKSVAMMQKLLQVRPSLIQICDENGNTLLHHAIWLQRCLVEFLIATKPSLVSQPNFQDETPLQFALKINDLLIVNMILKCISNLQQVDKNGNTLLHIAAHHCTWDVLQVIYAHDANSLTTLNGDQKSPFALAVDIAKWNAIELFLPNATVELIASTKHSSLIYSTLRTIVKNRYVTLERNLLPELIEIVLSIVGL